MATVPTPIRIGTEPQSTVSTKPKPKVGTPNRDGSLAELYRVYTPGREWLYANDSTGSAQPIGKGWDAEKSRLNARRRTQALNLTNATLNDGDGYQMSIFVTDVNLDTAVAGSTAQSQMVRDFYPHNLVQGPITLTGWSLDQTDYGLLCEFIHNCQHKAITSNSGDWPKFMTQLEVYGRSQGRGVDGTRSSGPKVSLSHPMPGRPSDPPSARKGKYFNQIIRGSHQPILAKGYVQNMPRIHRQFEYAVRWQMDFVIAVMLDGPYTDQIIGSQIMKTWRDLLVEAQGVGFSSVSPAENRAALSYATSHSATLTGAPPTGATTSNSTPGSATTSTPKGAQQQQTSQVAGQYGVSPQTIWGIYGTESSFGADPGNSGSGPNGGAKGPFQFEDATWAQYGGGGNVMNFSDALKGCCRYMAALGANSNPTSPSTVQACNNYNGNGQGTNASSAYFQSVLKFGKQFGS